MTRATVVGLAVIGVSASLGCAGSTASSPAPLSSAARLSEAVAAEEADDFARARPHLVTLASQCRDPEVARRAILLLAAAELDTANREGSALRAALLAERFLGLPGASPEELLLARTLYRLATHLQTLAPARRTESGSAPREAVAPEECSASGEAGSASTVHGLGDAEAPWLLGLDASVRASRQRIAELEAEMRRIDELLTSGAAPEAEEQGR